MGQSAVFDATIFLAIILVASSLLITLSNSAFQVDDVQSFENMFSYTKRLTLAALASTVPNASYIDINGKEMVRKDISVQDMMIEELLLLRSGVPSQNFEGLERYNGRIESVLSSLVSESPYVYEFRGSLEEVDICITNHDSSKGKNVEISAYSLEILVPGEDETLTITLQIWRK
jgi:hypothetical protein